MPGRATIVDATPATHRPVRRAGRVQVIGRDAIMRVVDDLGPIHCCPLGRGARHGCTEAGTIAPNESLELGSAETRWRGNPVGGEWKSLVAASPCALVIDRPLECGEGRVQHLAVAPQCANASARER